MFKTNNKIFYKIAMQSLYMTVLLSATTLLVSCNSSAAAEIISGNQLYCGYPLLHDVSDYSTFYNLETNASQQNIKFFDEILNQQNITAVDKQLITQFNKFPPYIIRRSSSKYLCDVLVNGNILSNGSNTPDVEKSLYGADNCVFTSLGSPVGQPQWGDVLISFDTNKMVDMWATPHSGWYYVMTYNLGDNPIRGLNAELLNPTTNHERNFMQKFVFTKNQWQDYMIDFFMLNYKALPIETQNEISNNLLNINNQYDFQMAVFKYNLGYYLEAHANKSIPLSDVTKIQISKSAESTIISQCPVAYQQWKNIIEVESSN